MILRRRLRSLQPHDNHELSKAGESDEKGAATWRRLYKRSSPFSTSLPPFPSTPTTTIKTIPAPSPVVHSMPSMFWTAPDD